MISRHQFNVPGYDKLYSLTFFLIANPDSYMYIKPVESTAFARALQEIKHSGVVSCFISRSALAAVL